MTAAAPGLGGSEGRWLGAELEAEQMLQEGARGFRITPPTPGAPRATDTPRQRREQRLQGCAEDGGDGARTHGLMPGTRALATMLVPAEAGTARAPSRC